jgi:hypothetical protein
MFIGQQPAGQSIKYLVDPLHGIADIFKNDIITIKNLENKL